MPKRTTILSQPTYINEQVILANFSRPANTTAYAAGDAVTDSTSTPTVITFTDCARGDGRSGIITAITMVDSANQSTKGSFELWLFDTTFTPDNDNAVFTPTDAELYTLLPNGVVPLTLTYVGDATSGAGGNAVYTTEVRIPFVPVLTSRDLYGGLVVRNAYTPISSERFDFTLGILQR